MRLSQHIGVALLLGGCAALAQASVIHKWVDADGVTHYSDEPPTGDVTGLEQIDLPTPAIAAHRRASDYYSIANQWRRMHRERIELERARAARAGETAGASRGGDTIVVQLPESRPSVTVLPRHRPRIIAPEVGAPPARRHPLAIPGRDWPVGLHPGRAKLRGGFVAQ